MVAGKKTNLVASAAAQTKAQELATEALAAVEATATTTTTAKNKPSSSFDDLFPLKESEEEQAPVAPAVGLGGTKAATKEAAKIEAVFDAKAFLRTVPHRPGCYRMYGTKDQVIYVGKAKDLYKRLTSYFTGHDHSLKTQALVSHIKHIEFTVTFSESEALLLENELIKKYQPHYNILLRDDKSYPYLHLTSDQEFAGIYLYRGARRKGGEYFGPFPDSTAVKDSLRLLQKLFPIRQCLDGVFAHRSRPCLMAQMGKCLAPCVPMDQAQVAHYQEQVDLLRLFLRGRNQELLQSIVAKMDACAERMDFEQAARLRDQLTALRRVQESNSIVANIDYPLDVIGWSFQQGQCCVHVLFIRQGRILGTRSFFPQHTRLTVASAPAIPAASAVPAASTVLAVPASASVAAVDPDVALAVASQGGASVTVEKEGAAPALASSIGDDSSNERANNHDTLEEVATSERSAVIPVTGTSGTSASGNSEADSGKSVLSAGVIATLASTALVHEGENESTTGDLSPQVEVLLSFLSQFYLNQSHEGLLPDEVVIDLQGSEGAISSVASSSAATQETQESRGAFLSASGAEADGADAIGTGAVNAQAVVTTDFASVSAASSVTALGSDSGSDLGSGVGADAGAVLQGIGSQDRNATKGAVVTIRPPELHVSHHRGGGARQGSVATAWALGGDSEAEAEQSVLLFSEDRDTRIAKAAQVVAEVKSKQPTATGPTPQPQAEGSQSARATGVPLGSTEEPSNAVGVGAGAVNEGAATLPAAHAVAVLQTALQTHLGKNIRFVCHVRGSKKRFVQLAMTNAQVALRAHLSSVQTAEQRISALEQLLGFSQGQLQRLECYDISHTMGELTVGSCVVFNREGADSSRYRRYNITGITPGDDFAAMHQVLTRRFRDPESAELPDLIFIDGGLGQLKQAEGVLGLAFAQQPELMPQIVAVAKGEGRKEGLETLIKAWTHEKINLELGNAALQLVLHIRDEAHRFAITGHRKRRAQARRTSSLEDIAGVGPKRRQALLQHLGGMQEVKRASMEELSKVPNISYELAQKIYEHLHGEDS